MTEPHFRTEPIRSSAYLDGARGESCKLRFAGICNYDPQTTVACHIRNAAFGLSRKADDFSVIDGCSACHAFLDQGQAWKLDRALLLEHLLRGLQETIRNRIERGILVLKLDAPTPRRERPTKPRKPREQRKRIVSAKAWPEGRKIQQRNDLGKVRT